MLNKALKSRLRGSAKRFAADKSGVAAVTFAISALPIVAMLGLTFDASMAYRYKGDLQAAADQTTLTLARRSVMYPDLDESELVADGKTMFERKINSQNVPGPVTYNKFTVDTGRVDSVIQATVPYQTNFGSLVGMGTINILVEARAEFERNELDFYMMLDNSPSMATGADQQAINDLEDEFGCAFACHVTSAPSYVYKIMGADANNNGQISQGEIIQADKRIDEEFGNSNGVSEKWERDKVLQAYGVPTNGHSDTYDQAKALGIPLRIDAVAQGVYALTRRIDEVAAFPGQHRVGLSIFGRKAWDIQPENILSPTENMNTVRSKTNEIELMVFGGNYYGNTNFKNTFDFMAAQIRADMAKEENAKKRPVLFIVSDGVNNSPVAGSCPGKGNSGRCMEPVRAEYCETLKDEGVRIAVLYTPYLPLPSNGFWNSNIKPQMADLPLAMEKCATPGLFFEADIRSDSIEDAMVTLTDRAIRALRLTGM